MMCNKTDHRIECEKCGYPYSEARYPDDYDHPYGQLSCDASKEELDAYIKNNEVIQLHDVYWNAMSWKLKGN